jgi:hypothetical protein
MTIILPQTASADGAARAQKATHNSRRCHNPTSEKRMSYTLQQTGCRTFFALILEVGVVVDL